MPDVLESAKHVRTVLHEVLHTKSWAAGPTALMGSGNAINSPSQKGIEQVDVLQRHANDHEGEDDNDS